VVVALRSPGELVRLRLLTPVIAFAAACGGGASAPAPSAAPRIEPVRMTAAVSHDADDPAIWLNTADPAGSLIVGTNKVKAPDGALVVFGLDGGIRQTIAGLDRPNNVDIETGVTLGSRVVDLVATTERLQHRLRLFVIPPGGAALEDAGAVPVLAGESGESSEPMGVGLYKRATDGALFAIVAPKTGPSEGYLAQYRLTADAAGQISGALVRRFGRFSRRGPEPGSVGEIEAIAVDDALGYVYYADERFGIHKWHADPDHADASRELAVFGTEGYRLDREGLALYTHADGTGYLVSTDQIPGGSIFKLYRREGEPGAPHTHRVIAEAQTTADETDGIEVTSVPLPGLPKGALVAMDSSKRAFAVFDWATLFPGLR
jgi:3-phytase